MRTISRIGNETGRYLAESLLTEDKRVVAIYPGRFQPFHAGHYDSYRKLVDQFGKDNVFIATSNKQDPVRSPLGFDEKKKIIMSLFGVPDDKIVQTKNPYRPVEILDDLPDDTAYVTAMGGKDADRLNTSAGHYYQKFSDKGDLKGYKDNGYVVTTGFSPITLAGKSISGTEVRQLFGDDSLSREQKKVLFKKLYPKFDAEAFDLIVKRTSEAEKARKTTPSKPKAKKLVRNKRDTSKKVRNPKTGRDILATTALSYGKSHPSYSAARSALQMEAFLMEGVNDPGIMKAVLLAGGPGSGKSYTMGKLFGAPEGTTFAESGMKVINSDRAFEFLLKKFGFGLDLAALSDEDYLKATDPSDPNSVRNVAKKLTKAMMKRYKDERLGLIIDQTGHKTEKLADQKRELESLGYDVQMMFVHTPLEVALERNRSRPRRLPDHLVKQVWQDSMTNLEKYKEIFGEENVLVVDNSVYGAEYSKQVTGAARRMAHEPVKNPVGREWILQQKKSIAAKGREKNKQQKQAEPQQSKKKVVPVDMPSNVSRSAMNQKVRNPQTGRDILVKTALKYDKSHPAFQAAKKMLAAQYDPRNEEGKMISRALLMKEGGAYGHMNHPFDDMSLTFGDLKKIVELGLSGKLDIEAPVTEKTDGQNIMVSYRPDKGVIFARNKSHLRSRGQGAMNVSAIKQLFAGRGDIEKAFTLAANDLESAILKLTDKQKEKIFANGKNFMSLEIIYPPTQNVIPYGKNMLIFHDTVEFDDSGNAVAGHADSGRMLAGMIKQINQHIQQTFVFRGPTVVKLPKSKNFNFRKSHYIGRINRLQGQFSLKDNDEVMLWHQRWWEAYLNNEAKKHKYALPGNVLNGLIKRWAFWQIGEFTVNQMKKSITNPQFLAWALKFDKTGKQQQFKTNIAPFEAIFLDLGAEILGNMSDLVALNPDAAVKAIKADLDKAVKELSRSKDPQKLSKFKEQLAKLNSIGGGRLVPTEGIVFMYKDKIYKFTGTFAPLNQILGMLKFG